MIINSKKADSRTLLVVFAVAIIMFFFIITANDSSSKIVSGEFEFRSTTMTQQFSCVSKEVFEDTSTIIVSSESQYQSLREIAGCQIPDISFENKILIGNIQEQIGCQTGIFIFPKGVSANGELIIDIISAQQGDCETTKTVVAWSLLEQRGSTPFSIIRLVYS